MTRPSPSEARERIVAVLGQSVYHALGLKEVLMDERSALELEDTDALERAVDSKGRCIDKLQALEKDRESLCEASGFVSGPSQMQDMTAWCDENSIVADGWSQLMDVAAECNQLNLANGAAIRLRQQHTEAGLAVLRGSEQRPATYARTGDGSATRLNRSLAEV
ncbi:MAG: flagellar protein FlgN [Woeseiaceae bacterium]|nr:flagellar protein FlgN [Woeseiaceae bacterium]